ncbi:ATP-binding cassette domain-containing protein [Saccharomonospora sp. NPDC006951]
MEDREPLLDIRDLRVEYRGSSRHRPLRAVDGVSLTLARGETLGLVGESGSGKSTIGNAVLGLVKPSAGDITFDGTDLLSLGAKARRNLSERIQVVFQDPYGSLNPSRTIGQTLSEPLHARKRMPRRESLARVAEALEQVGLSGEAVGRYPAQFSGGQRQRIAIARALVLGPDVVICDEPTSSLDLSVQAQVLNLLLELQDRLGISYLFISHDIGVVRHLSHRVVVLRGGRVVEQGPVLDVTERPVERYTRELLRAAPIADPVEQEARRRERAHTTEPEPTRQGRTLAGIGTGESM